jgi:hypothetical protein
MKVTFFVNQPPGKTLTRLISMLPGLGDKTGVEIETVEKSREEYRRDSYAAANLPVATAVIIDGEVIAVQNIITQSQIEKLIENRLKAEHDET